MPRPRKPPSVYIHRQQWYCRFTCNGRQHIKPVGQVEVFTEPQARAKAAEIERTIAAQYASAKAKSYATSALARYQRRLDTRSIGYQEHCEIYRLRFIEFFGNKDMRDITRDDVEAWRDHLLVCPRKDKRPGTLSPKTVKEHIEWLAVVYNTAGLPNPCRGVERPKKTHAETVEALEFFTPDEMQLLFKACAERHPRYRDAFTIYAYTGCRASEIQNLMPSDIDTKNKIIWVTGKGQKRRALKLTGPVAPAWTALQRQLKQPLQPSGHIFPQGYNWPKHMMERICKTAFGEGGKHGHPHMLRHTLASMALLHFKPPWTIEFLAKWLGHSEIGITYRIYSHWIATEPVSSYMAPKGFNTIKKPPKK